MKRAAILLIVLALIAGMAGCRPSSQNLEIRDWYDLDAIRNNLKGHHILMNDLDSTTAGYEELASPTANQGRGWEPIGIFVPTHGFTGFAGTFDGQGYEIRDLFINRPEQGWGLVGLFGEVEEEAVIKDMGVMNVTVIGDYEVGGLVGSNVGTVSDCYSSGNVTGDVKVSGLVGYNHGTVSNSYSSGNVTGNSSVGGLVGASNGTVTNSFWDTETSGQTTSAGGTGKTTAEMKDITTFSGATWNIIAVGGSGERNPSYIWNIVDDETYPFLSWQPV